MEQQPYINPENLLKEKQRIADFDNANISVRTCSDPDYPYYRNGNCISVKCLKVNEVFDYSKDVCVACENYNATNHTCPPPPPPPAKYPHI